MRSLVWSDAAKRDLRDMDRAAARRVVDVVERYADTGYGDVKAMKGNPGEYRLRVGDYRVRFALDVIREEILITHVAHRREVYRQG
jgi:mRNA interferase RelE/StbE